jgi:hypothetical protein
MSNEKLQEQTRESDEADTRNTGETDDQSLIALEQQLQSLPGKPTTEKEKVPDPQTGWGRVENATKTDNDVIFTIATAHDGEQTVTAPWPEYDHPDVPLDHLLDAIGLGGVENFSNIENQLIPILKIDEEYRIHIPPRQRWKTALYKYGRALYNIGFIKHSDGNFYTPFTYVLAAIILANIGVEKYVTEFGDILETVIILGVILLLGSVLWAGEYGLSNGTLLENTAVEPVAEDETEDITDEDEKDEKDEEDEETEEDQGDQKDESENSVEEAAVK